MSAPVLEMQHISKRFDVTQALDDASLALYPGEIHALLGENGAGKSTLIKIMTGIHRPDRGQILLAGKPISIHNSVDAQKHGIAAIHQEPMIFPDLNVAENIFISHVPNSILGGLFLDWGRMYQEAEELLAQLDIKLDVRSQARGLTLAQQQAVEIAKASSLKVRVLIMDEPTASLSAHEVDQLFKLARRLRQQGVALLFISHRMEEVFAIADRITVMRDGKVISTGATAEYTTERVIRDMVGRKIEDFFAHRPHKQGDILMSVRGLSRARTFYDINFDIRRGEVLGFAGLVGARRTDIGLALFGVEPATSGEIIFEGQRVEIRSPEQAVALRIAYTTEDRRQLGLTLPMSITTNITLPMLREYLAALGLVRRNAENVTGEEYRKQLAIRAPSVQHIVGKLSGGNQQKVMLAKWLNTRPKLLILDEPTRGIDVGTKAEVHRIIGDLAAAGMAIILISSDLPEALAMSDRILVMREGHQMAIFDRADATQERVLAAAMGQAQPTNMQPEAQVSA